MLPEHDGKNWETQEELLPSGHQAPKLKLSLITSTWLHLIISKSFIILHHPYCCYVYTLYNLFAYSSCIFLLILLLIKSTVYCPAHSILLHNLSYILLFFTLTALFFTCFLLLLASVKVYFYFLFCFFFHTNIYVYSLVFVLHIIALSMERTWLTFHCWLYSV